MKGKDTFSSYEAEQIKMLLREKQRASREDQKFIRRDLRNLEFYITDYDTSFSGFTEADFSALVESGQIKIVN